MAPNEYEACKYLADVTNFASYTEPGTGLYVATEIALVTGQVEALAVGEFVDGFIDFSHTLGASNAIENICNEVVSDILAGDSNILGGGEVPADPDSGISEPGESLIYDYDAPQWSDDLVVDIPEQPGDPVQSVSDFSDISRLDDFGSYNHDYSSSGPPPHNDGESAHSDNNQRRDDSSLKDFSDRPPDV
jgi:hypothetical protein